MTVWVQTTKYDGQKFVEKFKLANEISLILMMSIQRCNLFFIAIFSVLQLWCVTTPHFVNENWQFSRVRSIKKEVIKLKIDNKLEFKGIEMMCISFEETKKKRIRQSSPPKLLLFTYSFQFQQTLNVLRTRWQWWGAASITIQLSFLTSTRKKKMQREEDAKKNK